MTKNSRQKFKGLSTTTTTKTVIMKGESPTLNRQKQAPRGVLTEKCFENT